MIITTTTMIGFKMPDEYKQLERFRLNNDMREWKTVEDTRYTTLVRTTHSAVMSKEEEDA